MLSEGTGAGMLVARRPEPRSPPADALRAMTLDPHATTPRSEPILVVDDDHTLLDVVSRYLTHAGLRARVAASGEAALDAAAEQPPALVILDLGLPDMDGLAVMHHIRDRHGVPVIVLTARGQESERILGLRLGADDYVAKPFNPHELVARVEGILRRTGPAQERQHEPLDFGELRIDPQTRRVSVRGQEVRLTTREYELLVFLARHPGQVFSREQLLDIVWQYSFYGGTTTVTVHIRRVRAKLGDTTGAARLIETVRGVGYRFQPPAASDLSR